MKKHSMPDMKEGGVNVTPLIDIIMCLIVFFMLVTKVGVSRGVDKTIKLPNAIYGAKISEMGNTLTINVHKPTTGLMPQVTTIVNNEMRDLPIFIDATRERPLRVVLTEFKRTHIQKAQVIIRGDADMDYSALENVLMEISAAGVSETAYETTNKPQAETPAAP